MLTQGDKRDHVRRSVNIAARERVCYHGT